MTRTEEEEGEEGWPTDTWLLDPQVRGHWLSFKIKLHLFRCTQ